MSSSTSNHSSPSSSNSHSAYINGNTYVDEIINISQRDNKLSHSTLQWIPYDELEDVKELAKNDYSSISVARWTKKKKQGVFKKMSGGKAQNEVVVVSVKTLFNSKFVSKEFIEEFKRHFVNDTSATKTSSIYGFTRTPSSDLAIIATYYPSNLYAYLSSHTLTPLHKLRLLHTIATRLSTLHNSNLSHRAVHGGNVLVNEGNNEEENETCSAELVDFGIPWTDGGVFGVPEYVDPSVIVGGSNAWDQADIFAFGIIMWEVAYERFFSDEVGKVIHKPFIKESHSNAGTSSTPTNSFHRSIYSHLLPLIDDTIPPLYASLIRRCWHPLSSRRPSADELTKTLNVFVKSLESRDSYPEIRSQFDENWNRGQANNGFANGWNGSKRKTFMSVEKWDGWSEIVKKWEEEEALAKSAIVKKSEVYSKSRNSEEITASCTSKDEETDDADTINGGQELMSDDNLSRVEHGGDSDEEHNKVTGRDIHVTLSLDAQSSKLTSKDDHSAVDNVDAGSSTSHSQSSAVPTNDDTKKSSALSDADNVKSIQQGTEVSKGDDATADWVDVNAELKNMQIEGVTDDQMKKAYNGKTKHKRTPNASKSEGSHSGFSSPAATISRLLSHSVSSIDLKRNANEATTGKAIKTKSVKIRDGDDISPDSTENESGDSKQVTRRKSRVLNAFKNMKQKLVSSK